MESSMKKRWISLFVENEIGVLAKISGLFSGKSYNLDSLTVGVTEDPTVSRITICVTSDDKTFEQIKKQLNRSVEVIKVVDFTNIPIIMKEIMFIKINSCSVADKDEIFHLAQVYNVQVIDYNKKTIMVQCVKTEERNNDMIRLFSQLFQNRIEVVRGGSVAIESISITER